MWRTPPTDDDEFNESAPNPALAATTAEKVVAGFNLPPQPPEQVVSCRGHLCKLLLPMDDARRLLLARRVMGLGYRVNYVFLKGRSEPLTFLRAVRPRAAP